jgi:hypothetical protein
LISDAALKQIAGAKKILTEGEDVEVVLVQRRFVPGGALIYPKIVIATNKRVIIETREMFGLRREFSVIAYRAIVNVRLEKGIISSTVLIKSEFYGESEEGYYKIEGITYNDAVKLVEFIDHRISEYASHGEAVTAQKSVAHPKHEGSIHCRVCGAENGTYANFCSVCGARL